MIRCKREQLGVKRLSIKHKHSGCSRRRGGGRADEKPGTKSKLAFCVCSDVKFCHIHVPLPPLAAAVSQRIRLQSAPQEVRFFRFPCHSLGTKKSLDRPAVVLVHSGMNYYCLKSSTPADRLSVGTTLSLSLCLVNRLHGKTDVML